ncbi:MAG TPA: M15 family metallopeptidase [Methylophilaceae bacterium]|nr:M15 family metallopeptidase [Methylophilaceae bacterium]
MTRIPFTGQALQRVLRLLLATVLLLCATEALADRPPGFVYLDEAIPTIRLEMRYASNDNFIGRPIDGYHKPRALLTAEAALALLKVQDALADFKLGLKVYDAYRPQRAVNDFLRWAADPADTKRRAEYYPEVEKPDLFQQGYLAEHSGHSRGSTVDLTIVELDSGKELDMGGRYDYFGPLSWPTSTLPTPEQRASRMLLQSVMLRFGFVPYPQEWWHFTLKDEPYPDQYFDFPVE